MRANMTLQLFRNRDSKLLVCAILAALQCATLAEGPSNGVLDPKLPEVNGQIFYYFGYGSNMLMKRIHIQNPTAVKIGPGLLQHYRLDFNTYTEGWRGAPATIVPEQNATTYGTLWEIELSNLDDLDNQEGVPEGIYAAISVPVQLLSNETIIIARTYHLVDQPTSKSTVFKPENLPLSRQPSKTYLQCLVKGAQETGLPTEYIHWLQSLKHNGEVSQKFESVLELSTVELLS